MIRAVAAAGLAVAIAYRWVGMHARHVEQYQERVAEGAPRNKATS